ncbi:threonine aldolase family protein [Desulfoplanes formicivorans]|uniref:Amino acid lyase n=1 Tax=Desulfoplanes formicivorans TaxID=1592317 RepID=A0A194AHK7_9BACT|nr:low specificity L-threonine aldolase [Desulfoplanes formicivorans]GAU08244.1 amino acid lyase [Desulfoplanes formicivorans]
MYVYSFLNDYSEGAHPDLLKILATTNEQQEMGYGEDTLCQKARELILAETGNPAAEVHFVSGGTQANLIVLASMLKPYESVIAADSGHINVHETGAIESTGHKVHGVPALEGKIRVESIRAVVEEHGDEHMVHPAAVYISDSTELGTVYTLDELEEIAAVCRELGLYLHLDGARLGCALTSTHSDVTMADIARLTDVLYIGGTKNGALLGEAIVISNRELQSHFRYHIKQRGGMLAKGRVLGSQFAGLFTDGLFYRLAEHANTMAARMARGIEDLGFSFATPPQTNQVFPVFPNELIRQLNTKYAFHTWEKAGPDQAVVRLVTSWATPEKAVDGFVEDLGKMG